MNSHSYHAHSPSPTRATASSPSGLGTRIRAAIAALAAWRRRRALAAQEVRASRELAGLSAHVLRDIGARDAAVSSAGRFGEVRTSALDLEIRG